MSKNLFRLVLFIVLGLVSTNVNAQVTTNPTVKPSIVGLVSMGSEAFFSSVNISPPTTIPEVTAHPGAYSGAVILDSWDLLEPSANSFNFSVIDQMITSIKAYNSKYPTTPIVGKIRIFAGDRTPSWVLAAAGSYKTVDSNGKPITLAKWWTPEYHNAWLNLVNALAARYDTNPLIEEVAVSSCSTITAEPMVQSMGPKDISVLQKAGYTDAAGHACITNAISDYASWKHTSIDFTFNPWRDIDSGHDTNNSAFTIATMQAFRAKYNMQAVLANHGLQPTPSSTTSFIFSGIKSLGSPIEFQTVSPSTENTTTLNAGIKYGMSEWELWNSTAANGSVNVSTSQLVAWKNTILSSTNKSSTVVSTHK
jgi:hypothetical protein